MYCGEVLPKHQIFSENEKETILANQKQAELDEAKVSKSKSNNHFGRDGGVFYLGGDSGGSCD